MEQLLTIAFNFSTKICSDIFCWTSSSRNSRKLSSISFQIFVKWFSWAMLSENCSLLGTDDVFGQVSEHNRVLFYRNSALIVFKSNFPSFWNTEIANPVLWICSHELSMLLNFTPILLLHENKGRNTIIFLHVWWKWVPCLNITFDMKMWSHIFPQIYLFQVANRLCL